MTGKNNDVASAKARLLKEIYNFLSEAPEQRENDDED